VEEGSSTSWTGTDHLLFLFALVIPFRRMRALIPIVTAFTVAHSVTLIASALRSRARRAWFPPLIETLIATSIFYMALENIVDATPGRRWIITFCFGLVHGFGFSFGLRTRCNSPGNHLLTSLCHSNIGVEFGQLFVLLLMIPVLEILFRYVVAERMGTIILSVIAGTLLALDDRAFRNPAAIPLSADHGGGSRQRAALADGRRCDRRDAVADLARDAKWIEAQENERAAPSRPWLSRLLKQGVSFKPERARTP
jgi:hypothetical protein